MSSQQQQQQQQQLLLQKEVFTAYLQPLLKQHAANEVITYEDLTKSWQAAMGVIGSSGNNGSSAAIKTAVVRMFNPPDARGCRRMVVEIRAVFVDANT